MQRGRDNNPNHRSSPMSRPLHDEAYNYAMMIVKQYEHRPSPYWSTRQTDFNITDRAKIINWLISIHSSYTMYPESLFLAVNIFDRYISKHVLPIHRAQVYASASLFIAVKFTESNTLKAKSLCQLSGYCYSMKELYEVEISILTALDHRLMVTTARDFLDLYFSKMHHSKDVVDKAAHVLEYSLLDSSLLWYDPSDVATAAYHIGQGDVNTSCEKALYKIIHTTKDHYQAISQKYGYVFT